jgi:hypothetical protein
MPHPDAIAFRDLALSSADRRELDAIVADAGTKGLHVDEEAIAVAIYKVRITSTPALPSELIPIGAQDDGRWFELTLDIDPTDAVSIEAAHARYREECRRVLAHTQNGLAIAAGWAGVRPPPVVASHTHPDRENLPERRFQRRKPHSGSEGAGPTSPKQPTPPSAASRERHMPRPADANHLPGARFIGGGEPRHWIGGE